MSQPLLVEYQVPGLVTKLGSYTGSIQLTNVIYNCSLFSTHETIDSLVDYNIVKVLLNGPLVKMVT